MSPVDRNFTHVEFQFANLSVLFILSPIRISAFSLFSVPSASFINHTYLLRPMNRFREICGDVSAG
jgi:hypothetical protein